MLALKPLAVSAVELLDRAALRSVENKAGLPPMLRQLDAGAAALLIEVRGGDEAALERGVAAALAALQAFDTIAPARFSSDPAQCEIYWNVRKGIFPSVGAMRATGTTVIIEDVAFPLDSLAAATLDLQALLRQYEYHEAVIFGHALEGNLHFVFTQDFGQAQEVQRYRRLMEALCDLVVNKYQGSLKAEHGTGRNMAPFVELEWGREATALMYRIKQSFDPAGLLNPGVILNDNPTAHLEHLKPLPTASALVDKCIECGFCEPKCPSHQLTLSPRQRIIAWRELAGEAPGKLAEDYVYMGLGTCAGCSLCASACPVGIDTGALVRDLRGRRHSGAARRIGRWSGNHFGAVALLARLGLRLGHGAASIVGERTLATVSGGAWRRSMPRAAAKVTQHAPGPGEPVVYFPSCASRIFGPDQAGEAPLPEVI